MDIETCEKLISEMEKAFKEDKREFPNNHRRGQFRVGWKAATGEARIYSESTLESLTWNNLGYRLGKKLGNKNDDEINKIFESFANHYLESR